MKEVKANQIKVRLRLIIINKEKVLLMYDSVNNYYFYVGGKLEYGESILEGACRETAEECGDGYNFKFEKILYVRDFISLKDGEHSVELFVLGSLNKYSGLEKRGDKEFNNTKWLTWKDIRNLPQNLYPAKLTSKLQNDYISNFPREGEYVGKI